jgi:hypothetical protein
MKIFLFVVGLLILVGIEILRVYFIMPFPGSQHGETISAAYFIESNINLFRITGVLLIAYPSYHFVSSASRRVKWTVVAGLLVWIVILYLFNFQFLAEKVFYQPQTKLFLNANENKISDHQLVLGVAINGEAKAYPIELIGYHHQVRDSVGGAPVMVTYCTVCRTGRVYSPSVDGQPENFRLVGMDHFNAMFEDSRTKSWWRQANGEAIAGPLKGKLISEVPSEQLRLDAWIGEHPNTLVMQPDSAFIEEYEGLKNYDEGKSKGKLTRADSLSWREKSWVVGVPIGLHASAYDWNDLKRLRVIEDVLANTPILVTLENDSVSFHVYLRDTLNFLYEANKGVLMDSNTQSIWSWKGECVEGKLLGSKLQRIQSYQEFWHSWKGFHPNTSEYHPKPEP